MIKNKSKYSGFTIVELIIAISVIAILAALTTVAYNGIQAGAKDKTVLSDLENMDAAQTRYSLLNSTNGKAYYSGGGYDADLDFNPSGDDVIDVVIGNSGYCIRGYNPGGNKNTIDNSFTKESQPGACIDLAPSFAAGGTGTSSLMGWWKFNGNANDSSGNGHNGTVSGPTLTTDKIGKKNAAYAFSGASTQYIDTNFTFPVTKYTVSAWIKPDGTSPSSFATIISNTRDCCSTYNGFQIQYSKASPYTLVSRMWSGGAGANSISYNGLTLNAWNFVTASYNGLVHKLYLNGSLVGSNNITATIGSPAYDVFIGKMGAVTSNYSFGGSMDDVRIYDYQLTNTQVMTLYNNGSF